MGGHRADAGHAPVDKSWHIRLLGDVAVSQADDALVRITRRQDRVVLAHLVLARPTPVSRTTLATLIWADDPPPSWETSLRGTLSRLRAALREAGLVDRALVSSRGSLRIDLPTETDVDLERAETLLAAAENGIASDPSDARLTAAEASDLLDAPFLADCHGSWVEARRAWLAGLRRRVAIIEAEAALETGDHEAALRAAERALGIDAHTERAHRVVIAARAVRGDRAGALDAYDRCFRLLRDDLGIAPGPEIEAAYLQVLGAEPTHVGPMAFPFVGRTTDRADLASTWNRVQAGEAEAVILVGESGIGKTRLAEEMSRTFEAVGALVLHGREDHVANLPYRSLAEVLADYVAQRGVDQIATLGSSTDDLARLWPRLTYELDRSDRFSRRDDDPTGDGAIGPEARWRLFDAVARWLALAARHEPVVVVMDDLHWASPSTLELLCHLLDAGARSRLLILGTRRPLSAVPSEEFSRHNDAWAGLLKRSSVHEITMEGLDVGDVGELIGEALGVDHGRDDVAEVASTITRQTGGNSLLVTEVLRRFGSAVRGRRHATEGPVDLVAASGELLGSAIDDLIGLRLAALGRSATRVMQLTALSGARSSVKVIAAAHGEPGSVDHALRRAVAAGMVTRDETWVEFCHEIVRTSIARGIAVGDAPAMHRRLAVAAESTQRDDDIPYLAHHWSQAASLGDVEATRAVEWCRAAGHLAVRMAEFDRAAEHFGAALDALALVDPAESRVADWCDLWTLEGEALHAAGHPRFSDALGMAISAARRAGDPVRLAHAALALSDWGMSRTFVTGGDELVDALREAHRGVPVERLALRAQVQATLALELRFSDAHAGIVALADDAVALADAADEPAARAAAIIARAGLGTLDPTTAQACAADLRRLGDELASAPVACNAAVIGFDAGIERGDVARARDELALLRRIVGRVPLPYFQWVAMTREAGLEALSGRYDVALEAMARAAATGEVIGLNPVMVAAGHAGLHLGVALETGDLAPAIARLRTLEPYLSGMPSWHASMAVALAESADSKAISHLAVVFDSLDMLHRDELGYTTMVNAARAAARLGDDRATRLVAPLSQRAGHLNWASCVSFGPVDLALAWAAIASGDDTVARGHLHTATLLCRRAGLDGWLRRIETEHV